jgi:hypothetical protein
MKHLYYVYDLLLAAYGGFITGLLLLPQGVSRSYFLLLLGGVLGVQLLKEVTTLVLRCFRPAVEES